MSTELTIPTRRGKRRRQWHPSVRLVSVGSVHAPRQLRLIDWLTGDRHHLAELLTLADPHPDRDKLIERLRRCTVSKDGVIHGALQVILQELDIAPSAFFRLLEQARLCEARIRATRAIADSLPDVAEDTMRVAKPYKKTCERCKGRKTIYTLETTTGADGKPTKVLKECPDCDGDGWVVSEAKTEDRRTALELGGLLKKGGGLTITQIQQSAAVSPQPDSLAELMALTDKVLSPLRTMPVIEGKVEPPSEDPPQEG